jgi:hypothetical protein
MGTNTGLTNVIDYTDDLATLNGHLDRIAAALEGLLLQSVDHIAEMRAHTLELKMHTTHLQGIEESNQGQWDCCKNGSERSEALIDAVMNNPDASPPEKLAIRDEILRGGD